MQSTNYYALTISIPEYVETDITSLDREHLSKLADWLLAVIRDPEFPLDLAAFGTLTNGTIIWLTSQSTETHRYLLKCIAKELL